VTNCLRRCPGDGVDHVVRNALVVSEVQMPTRNISIKLKALRARLKAGTDALELSTISDASGVLRVPPISSQLVELMGRRRERCPDSE